MAFHRPGLPRNRRPRARARGLPTGVARCGSCWPCWLCWVFGSLGRGSGGWALTGISVTRGVGGALAARRVWRVGLASWPSTTQALRTGMLSAFHLRGAWYRVLAGCGAMAQLVARLHGMQKVRGSNPLSSTHLSDLCSMVKTLTKTLTGLGFFVALVQVVFVVVEDAVHHGRSPADRGHDHVAVDGLGDVGG